MWNNAIFSPRNKARGSKRVTERDFNEQLTFEDLLLRRKQFPVTSDLQLSLRTRRAVSFHDFPLQRMET